MSDPVQTTSDGLCKLVRWAHSHGTICSLIPSLQQLTCGSHGTALTPEPGLHGGSVPVALWGCAAGHSYHWPLSDHGNGCRGSANTSQGPERFVGGRRSNKVTGKAPCDLCYSEAASEGEEFSSRLFDMAGCDSSATDEDGDYEPRPSRKRGGTLGRAVTRKKVKQEATSADDHDAAANTASTGPAVTDASYVSQACQAPNTHSPITHTLLPMKALPRGPQPLQEQDPSWERLEDPEMELLGGGGSCTTEKAAGEQNELENLHVLLCAERSRNQQMTEIISGLKQDKELLQNELTKKAELICDFLQDKLRPEKRWPCYSNPMEPGSSQMPCSDDVAGVDSPTIFDSFEEMELHPLDRHRTPKSKRSRDGENTRVRMKNVVGVIARYMAALQEFRCSVSMKVAFDRVGVDRNTISRTAAIAELSLAAPEVFHALAPWDEKEETLAHYAHRCRQAMDDNTKAKIKTMKAKGELLPIVSK
ncbi:coiled-coil domain-containing protein 106 [Clinocottus analis]|uniref:coiled-coil domain-containing protein 106 n=1 Tax=Clinocottus analis TaxID=304258 RepID=UPI0035BEF4BD